MKFGKDKEKKSLSPVEMKAKTNVLEDLRSMAEGMMKEKLGGLKKVSVASDSKEGLEKGLEKAKQIVEGESGMAEMLEDAEDGDSRGDDLFAGGQAGNNYEDSNDDMSPEHADQEEDEEMLNKKLEELMKKKEALKAKKKS